MIASALLQSMAMQQMWLCFKAKERPCSSRNNLPVIGSPTFTFQARQIAARKIPILLFCSLADGAI
jgi:hypothetical protein